MWEAVFNLKSIISNGLVPGGQELNGRQSVYFLPVDPRDEDHRDPEVIDYSVPRRARYLQKSWKMHQDTVFWINIDQGIIREGLRFYQTKSNIDYSVPRLARSLQNTWKKASGYGILD